MSISSTTVGQTEAKSDTCLSISHHTSSAIEKKINKSGLSDK